MEPMSERYVNVAVPVAVLVTAGRSLAPERVAAKRSLTWIPTLSVQLLSAIAAASVTPPNMTCLRMSASVPQGERGTAHHRSYAYPPDGSCQAGISNTDHYLRASCAARALSAASISPSDTGAGTVHCPRCITGTRIRRHLPFGPELDHRRGRVVRSLVRLDHEGP